MDGRDVAVDVLAADLVARAGRDKVALTGPGGLLTDLISKVLSGALEAEMGDHLGHEHSDRDGKSGSNKRNGSTTKTVRTEVGPVLVRVPRDREGSFEPVTVPKHARRVSGFEDMVISLYAKGMTTGDITKHLRDIFGDEVSRGLVSRVTDQIMDDFRVWNTRPLDEVYPVILIDAIVIKTRDVAVGNRPVYVVVGINMDGERDVLGMWMGPSGGEGAKHWLAMLAEVRNRGVQDVFIACCDGLKGLPEAIEATWPLVQVQQCVVHLIRNSLKYASKKYWPQITKGLKTIYMAPSVDAAEQAFDVFADQWEERYPAMIASWRRSWPQFVPFLQFSAPIRKLIYTTNAIESLNARFRAAMRRRGHFPTEDAALKVLYLTVMERRPNRVNPTGRVPGWKKILNTLTMTYADRLNQQ